MFKETLSIEYNNIKYSIVYTHLCLLKKLSSEKSQAITKVFVLHKEKRYIASQVSTMMIVTCLNILKPLLIGCPE